MTKRILIVEDQDATRELVCVTLGVGEYQILEACDADQGLALAREHRPQLILMDVSMPGDINGLEATRLLKKDPATRGCRIIMLTANSQQQEIEDAYAVGADGYFTKPFSPLELIQRVEEELE